MAGLVKEIARPGDYVVCLGAGNITQWAYALPGELAALGCGGVKLTWPLTNLRCDYWIE